LIVDRLGRQFRNLRLSLTAACNYACTYCVPDGKRLLAADAELDAAEMVRAVQLLMDTAGIDKLRITGGEPLLSPKFDEIMPQVMELGLLDISLTTNGQLLPRKAGLVIDSGLTRINISLDTLDASGFRAIARSGDLATVLQGIDLMLAAGIKVKINMVPMRHKNDDQILPMLAFCLERNIELRFIELMNMGHLQGNALFDTQFFGMQEILDLVATQHEFARTDAPFDSTAARFEIPGQGTFGIIANESEPFCGACSRLRLSSNGMLYGCLSNAKSYDMRDVMRLPDALAMVKLQSVLTSALADKQLSSFSGEVTVMKFIGG
jgi:cyclic pyranopterin phosphate synthase